MKPTNCTAATVGCYVKLAAISKLSWTTYMNETHYAHTLMPTFAHQYDLAHSWHKLLSVSLWHLFVHSSSEDLCRHRTVYAEMFKMIRNMLEFVFHDSAISGFTTIADRPSEWNNIHSVLQYKRSICVCII